MPLDDTTCDCHECSATHYRCPDCGERFVTPRDEPGLPTPTTIVDVGIRDLEDHRNVTVRDDAVEVRYRHVCWSCEWGETVTVTIERDGDDSDEADEHEVGNDSDE